MCVLYNINICVIYIKPFHLYRTNYMYILRIVWHWTKNWYAVCWEKTNFHGTRTFHERPLTFN